VSAKDALTPDGSNIGVKTERIQSNSSETIFISIFISDSKSEWMVCGYGIRAYRL
jgi:hypothetical protein